MEPQRLTVTYANPSLRYLINEQELSPTAYTLFANESQAHVLRSAKDSPKVMSQCYVGRRGAEAQLRILMDLAPALFPSETADALLPQDAFQDTETSLALIDEETVLSALPEHVISLSRLCYIEQDYGVNVELRSTSYPLMASQNPKALKGLFLGDDSVVYAVEPDGENYTITPLRFEANEAIFCAYLSDPKMAVPRLAYTTAINKHALSERLHGVGFTKLHREYDEFILYKNIIDEQVDDQHLSALLHIELQNHSEESHFSLSIVFGEHDLADLEMHFQDVPRDILFADYVSDVERWASTKQRLALQQCPGIKEKLHQALTNTTHIIP